MNTSTSLSDYPTQLEGMSFDGILDLTADVFLFYGNVELGLTFLFSSTGTRNVHQVTIMSLAGCGFVIYFLDSARRNKPCLTLNTTRIQNVPKIVNSILV